MTRHVADLTFTEIIHGRLGLPPLPWFAGKCRAWLDRPRPYAYCHLSKSLEFLILLAVTAEVGANIARTLLLLGKNRDTPIRERIDSMVASFEPGGTLARCWQVLGVNAPVSPTSVCPRFSPNVQDWTGCSE